MNGVGLFVDRVMRGPILVEAGLGLYARDDFLMAGQQGDHPVDRKSALVTTAVGLRKNLSRWLTAYLQVGGGVELTKVSVPYGSNGLKISDAQVLPAAFIGTGGDIRLGAHIRIGANIRFHAMGNFDYDAAKLQMQGNWPTPPPAEVVFAASPDLAAQAQFYVRHDL